MKYEIPVEPTILAHGEIASLVNLAKADDITISGNGPTTIPDKVDAQVLFGAVDESVVASAGFGQMLGFNANVESEYLLSDVQMLLDPVKGKGIIETEYYGVSWRLCIKAWGLSADTKINVSSIAADCSINSGSATMQSHIYGIDNSLLVEAIPSLCSVIGNFNTQALQQIKIVQNMVMKIFSSKDDIIRSGMQPVLLGVDLKKTFQAPYVNSPSAVYAFHAIDHKYSYNDAIKYKPKPPSGMTFNDSIIKAIYKVMIDNTSDKKPNSSQSSAAYRSVFKNDDN
jgi:hypothetical protein